MDHVYKLYNYDFVYNYFSTELLSCKNCIPTEWNDEIILKPENLYISFYSISSFYYGVAGLIMLLFFKNNFKLIPHIPIPIEFFSIMLFIQSILSYFADVLYINNVSYWHTIDRIVTCINIFLFFSNIFWISYIEKVYFIIVLFCGVILFKKSRDTRNNKNIKEYLLRHQIWHMFFPLAIVLWLSYRKITNKQLNHV